MYKFDWVFPTPKEHTKGKNTCQYIILHHTWTKEGTVKWVLDWLNKRRDYASCHFLVDDKGKAYKMWQPTDILWHAWESRRWELVWMNRYSMWIEIIWPCSNWWFTDKSYDKVVDLTKYLMNVFWIPVSNVLRHADITWPWAKKKFLRDGITRNRKRDLSSRFREDRWYKTFTAWKRAVLK